MVDEVTSNCKKIHGGFGGGKMVPNIEGVEANVGKRCTYNIVKLEM